MNLLGIETSTENCSAAVSAGGRIYGVAAVAPQRHAELILGMCDQVLRDAGIGLDSLDGIVFGRGPGSFTGERIAASAAQGLALGLGLRCAGVCSLEAMALQSLEMTPEAEYALSAVDARMGEVYFAVYQRSQDGLASAVMPEPALLRPQVAAERLNELLSGKAACGGGSGMELLLPAGLDKNILKQAWFPDAQYIVKLGSTAFKIGTAGDPAAAVPLYVRNEVAWKKISGQHPSLPRKQQ